MSGAILTVIEAPESAPRMLSAAGCLAALVGGARIHVLAIRTPPNAVIMPSEEVLTRVEEVRLRTREEVRVAQIKAAYDAWAGAVPEESGTTWNDIEGDPAELIQQWGSRADAIVLQRPEAREPQTPADLVTAALFTTERPVLLVPPQQEGGFGRSVAIFWRDDKHSIAAVLAGLRCLQRAEEVHVLAGRRQDTPEPTLPPILAEHGIAATLHVLPILGTGVFGEALLAKAHVLGADLLVMGAFVHNPLRNLILGGVTRVILANADLPVLMRH